MIVRGVSLALLISCAAPGLGQEPPPPPAASPNPSGETQSLAEADRLWVLRSEGSTGGSVRPAAIDPVIAECRKVLEANPGSLEARWRLMRALYFKGEHATSDREEKKRIFDDGRKVGEEALVLLRQKAAAAGLARAERGSPVEIAPALKGEPAAAPCFMWAAADWGKWALVFGKTQAVKQGAAAKIRDYAAAVVVLDPKYDGGAGYRILGRLHHQTPSVPFLTGWASRSEALKNLRLAVQIGPRNLLNTLYLAEAMWDYESRGRGEARAMLERVIAETPLPAYLVEDRRVQEEAKALLAAWGR